MSRQTHSVFSGESAVINVMVLSAIVLTFAMAKELGLIDGSLAKRAVGMTIGAVLIVTGNVLPKIAQPISLRQRKFIGVMAADRFAGWTFVLTGIVYVAAWLFAPVDHVMLISSLVGLSAFLLVIATWAWLAWSEHSQEQHESLMSEHPSHMYQHASVNRGAIFLILHAIFWVLAMFLADSIWGDRVAQWMAVVFVIMNGVLITFMADRKNSVNPPPTSSIPPLEGNSR